MKQNVAAVASRNGVRLPTKARYCTILLTYYSRELASARCRTADPA